MAMCSSELLKMKIKLSIVLLYIRLATCETETPYCTKLDNSIFCEGTNMQSFLRELYSTPEETLSNQSLSVHITNSIFYSLVYFPTLTNNDKNYNIRNLAITNSSIGHVTTNALEELEDLQTLDLSWNLLKNILFIRDLPMHLKNIYLHHNSIVYVDDVFKELKELQLLDLSSNKISIIDLKNVYMIPALDFSKNKVESLVPYPDSNIEIIDLSFNLITEFNEQDLGVRIADLNLSDNKLRSIKLKCCIDKNYLNLSGNNISQFFLDISNVKLNVNTLNVSLSSYNKLLEKSVGVENRIILKDSNFTYLNNATVNLKNIIYQPSIIDISNSSILDISEHYFSYMNLLLLNLSYNRLLLLEDYIFSYSRIDIIDLSHSQIRTIKVNTFKGVVSEEIILSYNRITVINKIFEEATVCKIDLSFNPLKIINSYVFLNSAGLTVLNLANCSIEKIETNGLRGLQQLRVLDLSYNKLNALESNVFSNLTITELNLAGNNISIVQNKAFNQLYNLNYLDLSSLRIANIEVESFYNLYHTKIIDLRNNNIATIPENLFIGLKKLRKVLLDGNNITTMNPFSNRLKIEELSITFNGNLTANKISNLNIVYLNIKDSDVELVPAGTFGGLFNLRTLHFDNSHFKCLKPGALDNLYNLQELDSQNLFRNQKNIEPNTFKDLRSMNVLNLSNLSLESIEPYAFQGLVNLKSLYLDNNSLSTLNSYTFEGLPNLKILDLSLNGIEFVSTESFMGLWELQELSLENNNLSKISTKLFASLTNLAYLNLKSNQISTITNKGFSRLKNLLEINLQNNNIEDLPTGVFQYLPQLEILNLRYNKLKIVKNGAFSNLKGLKKLDLSYNELIYLEHVSMFFSLRKLEEFYLDGNHLKDFDFEKLLENLPTVRYVGISFNKWQCGNLSSIVECFNKRIVAYEPDVLVFDTDNIDGIGCIDICKFVYCSHESTEDSLHYYK